MQTTRHALLLAAEGFLLTAHGDMVVLGILTAHGVQRGGVAALHDGMQVVEITGVAVAEDTTTIKHVAAQIL